MLKTQPENDLESFLTLIESQNRISNRYSNIKRISPNGGGGQFSMVFVANDENSSQNREVILKFYNPLRGTIGSYRQKCFEREAVILKNMRGQKNILPIIQENGNLTIQVTYDSLTIPFTLNFYVAEKAKHNVRDYIYGENSNHLRSIRYFREICKSVQRIQKNRICHRDLKPDNFLIFEGANVCLSDFGSARDFENGLGPLLEDYNQMQIGDPRYMPLEILCSVPCTERSYYIADIFSLGAILFELFTKTNLTSIIFSSLEINTAISVLSTARERDREDLFDGIVDSISNKVALPNIRAFDPKIPKSVAYVVDELYKSLAAIDYRTRRTDFQTIFSKINICEKHILYYKKYEAWKLKKRKNQRPGE